MQRKLTDEELKNVDDARVAIGNMCEWDETAKGHKFWFDVALQLCDMLDNKTTDGKPWTDPEPPIPDGYRRAVKGDEGRADCKYWSHEEKDWVLRRCISTIFCRHDTYIVPVDRIPTDDDAKSRPVVMVRDHDTQKWEKETLIFVRNCERSKYKFATTDKKGAEVICWRFCRFPYPNETP